MNPLRNRVHELDVARVLATLDALPNRRSTPTQGDLAGNYDEWFDGGALRIGTGITEYVLSDGTTVSAASTSPMLSLTIRFGNGKTVHIEQVP